MRASSFSSNKSKLLLIGLLVFVIAVSGCLSSSGDKVRVIGFGQDSLVVDIDTEGRTSFDSLQPFIITVTAENIGPFDVTNVKSRLLGFDGITSATDPPEMLSATKSLSPSVLDRPIPEQKVPGAVGAIDWDVNAPFIAVDSPDREIILTGEVLYDTKSLATQRIVSATREHIENLEARGERLPTMPETDSVSGPVAIDMEIPIPYVKIVGAETEFRLKVSLDNDGTGTLFDSRLGSDYLTKVVMKIPPGIRADTASGNCDFVLASPDNLNLEKTYIIDESNNRAKLRLLEGGVHRDLNCRLFVSDDFVSGYNTFDISINAKYTYVQDVSRKLIVKGTPESPLKVRILHPTESSSDVWEVPASTEHICFEVTYQNIEVKSDLDFATNADAFLDTTQIAENSLAYSTSAVAGCDGISNVWDFTVSNPNMGTNGLYDLTVNVTYAGLTSLDVEKNAVNWCTTPSCT